MEFLLVEIHLVGILEWPWSGICMYILFSTYPWIPFSWFFKVIIKGGNHIFLITRYVFLFGLVNLTLLNLWRLFTQVLSYVANRVTQRSLLLEEEEEEEDCLLSIWLSTYRHVIAWRFWWKVLLLFYKLVWHFLPNAQGPFRKVYLVP